MPIRYLGFLFLAIIAEVAATTALKQSQGLTLLKPTIIVIVGYATAFFLMSLAMTVLPIGLSYAIWSGIGTFGVLIIGYYQFGERPGLSGIIGSILIISGVLVINLFPANHH